MRRTAQLLRSLLSILLITAGEGIQFLWLAVSSRAELSAEVLFLRKQLAFYREHQVPPRKLTDAARFSLVLWSHLFNWKAALMIVKPETLIGWYLQKCCCCPGVRPAQRCHPTTPRLSTTCTRLEAAHACPGSCGHLT